MSLRMERGEPKAKVRMARLGRIWSRQSTSSCSDLLKASTVLTSIMCTAIPTQSCAKGAHLLTVPPDTLSTPKKRNTLLSWFIRITLSFSFPRYLTASAALARGGGGGDSHLKVLEVCCLWRVLRPHNALDSVQHTGGWVSRCWCAWGDGNPECDDCLSFQESFTDKTKSRRQGAYYVQIWNCSGGMCACWKACWMAASLQSTARLLTNLASS